MYDTCYGMPGCKSSGQENAASCLPDDFDPAVELPYFARSGGVDHIFIFACNLHAFSDRIMQRLRHAVLLTTESFQTREMLSWVSL